MRIGAAAHDVPKDGDESNHFISLGVGDVMVLPAGTCHSNLESEEGYRYIGVYPEVRSFASHCLSYLDHYAELNPIELSEMAKLLRWPRRQA